VSEVGSSTTENPAIRTLNLEMIGMNNVNAMMEQEMVSTPPLAMQQVNAISLSQGEPQQNIHDLMEEMKDSQAKLIEQVKTDQQELQQLENVIQLQ
jgi:hypothetical protein